MLATQPMPLIYRYDIQVHMRRGFVHVDDCTHDIFFFVSVPKKAVAHSKIFPNKFRRHPLEKFGTCAYEHTAYKYGIFLHSCAGFFGALLGIRQIRLPALDKAIVITCARVVYILVTSDIVLITFVFLFNGRYIVVMKFLHIANYVCDNFSPYNVFLLSGRSPAGRTPCSQGIVRYTFVED